MIFFLTAFLRSITFQEKKAKPNFAFSEGEVYKMCSKDIFKDKNFNQVIQIIKEKFNNRLYDDGFEKRALKYLRSNIIATPCNKNFVKDELNPADDANLKPEDRNFRICIEMLLLYFKRKFTSKNSFYCVFTEKHVSILIQQLVNENTNIAKNISSLIIAIINDSMIFTEIIKNFVKNEIISYIEGFRHYKGIVELLNILNTIFLKEICDKKETKYIYKFVVLPIFIKSAIEIISDDTMYNLISTFIKDDEDLLIETFQYFCKYFSFHSTRTKTVILQIIYHILKNNQEVDFTNVILYINKIFNFVLILENQGLIEILFSMFIDHDILEILKNYINLIMPKLFENVYKLSQKYWNIKGKSNVFVILQRLMNCDKELFNICLQEFNIKREKDGLIEEIDQEMTNILFEACLDQLDSENILKMRKKSLIPFETDKFES
ncbi:serine/threonine-protein phosphatase 2A 56 kDa regulatory subunit delta isoform [Gurleya vavrai]